MVYFNYPWRRRRYAAASSEVAGHPPRGDYEDAAVYVDGVVAKSGKFTVVVVMIMDAAGDMVHMTGGNIFGTETVRKKVWCPRILPAPVQCAKG